MKCYVQFKEKEEALIAICNDTAQYTVSFGKILIELHFRNIYFGILPVLIRRAYIVPIDVKVIINSFYVNQDTFQNTFGKLPLK